MKQACLLIAAVLALASCESRVVTRVGEFEITQADVALRDKVIKIMYPDAKENYGLSQLITAYTSAQILVNNGHPITPEVLAAEEERIDKNTKLPETLTKIKAVFGRDKEAYRRVYILPVYAQRMIYFGFFLGNEGVQKASLDQAKSFLSEAQQSNTQGGLGGKSLLPLAEKHKLWFSKAEVSLEEGIEPTHWKEKMKDPPVSGTPGDIPKSELERQRDQSIQEARKWIEEVLPGVKPGQVVPRVVDNHESWRVLRYLGRLKNGHREVEIVDLPKANYQEWLEAEKARVPVVKFD